LIVLSRCGVEVSSPRWMVGSARTDSSTSSWVKTRLNQRTSSVWLVTETVWLVMMAGVSPLTRWSGSVRVTNGE